MTPANIRPGGDPVHVFYLDDSKQDQVRDRRFQVIASVVIADEKFDRLEQHRGFDVEQFLPQELREAFEFKSCNLWWGNPPFDRLSEGQRKGIFEEWVD